MKPVIAFHPQHDASAAIYDPKDQSFHIFELEKITEEKHFSIQTDNPDKRDHSPLLALNDLLRKQFGYDKRDYEAIVLPSVMLGHRNKVSSFINGGLDIILSNVVGKETVILGSDCNHHNAHAWSSYLQSPFNKAFIIAYDGGGEGGTSHHIYQFEDNKCKMSKSERYKLSWGYTYIGVQVFQSIRDTYRLDRAGKFMALGSFGKNIVNSVIESCNYISMKKMDLDIDPDQKFYKDWFEFGPGSNGRNTFAPILFSNEEKLHFEMDPEPNKSPKRGIQKFWDTLEKKWKIPLYKGEPNLLTYDIAYTAQKWIEDSVVELIEKDYMDMIRECDNNLILTGGTAMNILVNTVVRDRFPDINVFVPPNPGDEGLALGYLYYYLANRGIYSKPKEGYKIRYNDFYPIDYKDSTKGEEVTLKEVSDILKAGKIIGFMQGRMENGPRALGNRSILCDASVHDMKDRVNKQVKFREWYRPFAPVCRKEDAPIYFESTTFDGFETMSYVARVKDEWKERLPAITHVDGTARLQTVDENDNKVLYDILTEFGGVLLNTSLNIKGKPIINRIGVNDSESNTATSMLKSRKSDGTGLDYIIVHYQDKFYLFK